MRDDGVDLTSEVDGVVDLIDVSWWNSGKADGTSNEGPDDGSAMAVVATDVGIGDDGVFKIIGILPSKIKGSREGFGNVTSRADASADDDFVGIFGPFQCLLKRTKEM